MSVVKELLEIQQFHQLKDQDNRQLMCRYKTCFMIAGNSSIKPRVENINRSSFTASLQNVL